MNAAHSVDSTLLAVEGERVFGMLIRGLRNATDNFSNRISAGSRSGSSCRVRQVRNRERRGLNLSPLRFFQKRAADMSTSLAAPLGPTPWRVRFKAPSEMQDAADTDFLVEGFLPAGITFIGGPPGAGKTFCALSLAKALHTGKPFLRFFAVQKPTPVIYLTPEISERAFKCRLRTMGLGDISGDGFICQTLTDGPATSLTDASLLAAVKDLNPVVFLDTSARFNPAEDENASMQIAQGLAKNVFGLVQKGARGVVLLHHSTKTLSDLTVTPTMDNTLRGSGDLAAMADAVYCVRCSDAKTFVAEVSCVKARDFDPLDTFEFQGRPYLDETGDLMLIRPPDVETHRRGLTVTQTVRQAVGSRVLLGSVTQLTTERARAVHSHPSNWLKLGIIRAQRHFLICFHAWTGSWIALALGKWPGPIRHTKCALR
jgi:AAA domain